MPEEIVVEVRVERGDGTMLHFGARAPRPSDPGAETAALSSVLSLIEHTAENVHNELADGGAGALRWVPIDSDAELAPAPSASYLTAQEQRRMEVDIPEHEFEPGLSGIACVHMVMRADFGEDCGLPAKSLVHVAAS